jgi:hypothetical protein
VARKPAWERDDEHEKETHDHSLPIKQNGRVLQGTVRVLMQC